jgi:hypothetical protein|tara:strand:+ start:8453 stop:8791 length:339 start_codon:yes stop_codon:yes gene_type:complete
MAIITDGGAEGYNSVGFLPSSQTVKENKMAEYKVTRENVDDVINGLSVGKLPDSRLHNYYFNTEEIEETELSSMIFEKAGLVCRFHPPAGAIGMFKVILKLIDPISEYNLVK